MTEHTEWAIETAGHLIEAGQVRRAAAAVGDSSPLRYDREFAIGNGYRERVAPPTFVDSLNPFYAGEPYPVRQEYPYEFSGGDIYILDRPVCVGDTIDVRTFIKELEDRIRKDGKSRLRRVVYEKQYKQRDSGELVATVLWTYVNFEGKPTVQTPARFVEPDSPWEELPAVVDSLDMTKIVQWAAAMGDWARIHYDHPFATGERGLRDVVGHGPRTTALLARVLTDWLGPSGRVTRLETRYRASTYPGDELTARAWVQPAAGSSADNVFDARLALVNQDGVAVTEGTARILRGGVVGPT